jgi:hypothetical protein
LTAPNDGRANLPVCFNLTASKRSDAGGTVGIYTRKNIALLFLVEVWAARQRRPTLAGGPPTATRLERGCVQSTSRSALKSSAAPGVFQQATHAKLLRLVFDTAALRHVGEM